ncbi:pyruvate dehydrogenase kinase [Cystobasidium minutum MCA 4210]|uniref:pyruvate dehydrogenase kinase n=1 Tax=Cystobasidium minutum MCA 4210 TaxID=1397322 RepID=UPI0034CEDBD7|eukprot:jgi/Rhomi1/167067/fgenesh1_kg.2_\
MAAFRITPELYSKIAHYASFPQTGVSLRQMVQFGQNPSQGTLLRASEFLAEELPIRLAHRVKDLDELPLGLHDMPSIRKVKNWYAQSFEELVNFPKPNLPQDIQQAMAKAQHESPPLPEAIPNPSLPKHMQSQYHKAQNGKARIGLGHKYYANPTLKVDWPPEVHEYNENFTKCLVKIKKRHDPVVTTVAQGIFELKKNNPSNKQVERTIQTFLDRFYMSRIGIRVLIGQHIALNQLDPDPNYVGVICTNTNVKNVCQEAIDNALFICEEHYGLFKGPPVHLTCSDDLRFMYIPSHLNHMLFEILKNSLRATVETHGADCENFPPIKVIVAEGSDDITIKISDEGGGIPRKDVPLIWNYAFTTAEAQEVGDAFGGSDFKAPLAGYGYGLPIARLYAQYLGGNLKLISMQGYGTDVYLHLSRLSESSEPLQ